MPPLKESEVSGLPGDLKVVLMEDGVTKIVIYVATQKEAEETARKWEDGSYKLLSE